MLGRPSVFTLLAGHNNAASAGFWLWHFWRGGGISGWHLWDKTDATNFNPGAALAGAQEINA